MSPQESVELDITTLNVWGKEKWLLGTLLWGEEVEWDVIGSWSSGPWQYVILCYQLGLISWHRQPELFPWSSLAGRAFTGFRWKAVWNVFSSAVWSSKHPSDPLFTLPSGLTCVLASWHDLLIFLSTGSSPAQESSNSEELGVPTCIFRQGGSG